MLVNVSTSGGAAETAPGRVNSVTNSSAVPIVAVNPGRAPTMMPAEASRKRLT